MIASLASVRVVRPADLASALAAWREHGECRWLAGGTDLIVNLRRGLGAPGVLIDLSGVRELGEFAATSAGLRIGAGITIGRLAIDERVNGRYHALSQAAAAVAGPGHRNVATVGGNLCLDTRCIYYNQSEWWRSANGYCLKHRGDICHVAPQGQRCHAAFSGDLAPALLALDAEIEIASVAGVRRMPLAQLYAEDGRAHLALKAGELVLAVCLPADPPRSAYEKVRTRASVDFPLAGVAAAVSVSAGKLTHLRVAVTGTNSCPIVISGTGALLGRPVDETLLQALDKLVQKQVQPMRTTLAASNYRRLAAAGLTRRLTARLCDGQAARG